MASEKVHTAQLHLNFIHAMRIWMADNRVDTIKEASELLGVNRVTMLKIMDGSQAPTTEQAINLCLKAGIDANWLFLNKGVKDYEEAMTLKEIAKALK